MIVFSLAIGQMGKPGLFQSQSSVCVCVYGACSNSVYSVIQKGRGREGKNITVKGKVKGDIREGER